MDVKRREQKIATSVWDVSPGEDSGLHEKRPCTQYIYMPTSLRIWHRHGHCGGVTSEASNVFRPLHSYGSQQLSTYSAVWSHWRCTIKRKTQEEVDWQRKRRLCHPTTHTSWRRQTGQGQIWLEVTDSLNMWSWSCRNALTNRHRCQGIKSISPVRPTDLRACIRRVHSLLMLIL